MQRAAPVPLKQFNPVFDDDFAPNKSNDPDRERATMMRLRRQLKKERKGAARELRKDARSLAAQREVEDRKRNEYLEGRGKRAIAMLETQEHAFRTGKKEQRKMAKLL